jgi:hypothetical protein
MLLVGMTTPCISLEILYRKRCGESTPSAEPVIGIDTADKKVEDIAT